MMDFMTCCGCHIVVLLSALLVFEPICASKPNGCDETPTTTPKSECSKGCNETILCPGGVKVRITFPTEEKSSTVDPENLKPHPHDFIPPKPKHCGRPKIIPDMRTYMPRVDSFPYPRRSTRPSTRSPNSYYFHASGPLFKIWRIRWLSS